MEDNILQYPCFQRSLVVGILIIIALRNLPGLAAYDTKDLAVVPLFDGTRCELLNTWGGAWSIGDMQDIGLQQSESHAGQRTLYIELGETRASESKYAQCLASGFGKDKSYYQTRDLTRYQKIRFSLQNQTGTAVQGILRIKDYRDSNSHSAAYRFKLPGRADWNDFEIPLAITGGDWTLEGQPDLTRTLTLDFVFQPQADLKSGRICLDELALVEPGGPVDIDAAPLPVLVEKLARRQWDGIWGARNRDNGAIPVNSYQSDNAGLNTTAAVLWMLPAAIRHSWVEQAEADRYVELVLVTINRLLDSAKYVPPRYIDLVTLRPSLLPEESSVDAAFLVLALHQYESLPATPPALREALKRTENRFDLAAFAADNGWRMAYRYATPLGQEGFVPCIYDGYTNESGLISLAAHLNQTHHVPIETHWNANSKRIRAGLDGSDLLPLVHSMNEFRAPFVQALWNLFVDVRARGVDNYPDGDLAANPWLNFVCYEKMVLNRLAVLGRPYMVQPDAGDDETLACYRQFSLYNNFGQNDLFMPWSASFALLTGADEEGKSLRFLLRHGFCGALGLADSAKWATGAPEPYAVTARQDFWNTGLSTMAMLEWLDGAARLSKSFADLPEVQAALDKVFPAEAEKNPPRIQPVISQISP